MPARPLIKWLAAPALITLVALAIVLRPHGGSAPAEAQAQNAMAVVGPGDQQFLGTQFDVEIRIDIAQTAYAGYQVSINYDPTVLAWVSVPPNRFVYTSLGDMTLNLPAEEWDFFPPPGNDSVYGFAVRPPDTGTTTATGTANIARFQCIAPGSSPLHLVTWAESPAWETTTVDANGTFIPTELMDASITCLTGTPTPTPVGGIAERPGIASALAAEAGAPAQGSGWWAGRYAALASGLAAGAIAAAWYARRRCLR